MNLEQQVVSLELANRLKELGVKQESFAWWHEYHPSYAPSKTEAKLFIYREHEKDISAFTVAELGEMLVRGQGQQFLNSPIFYAHYLDDDGVQDDTEANGRAKMLIHLLENKLITV